MDTNTTFLIILIILVALVVFGIWLFRRGNVDAEVKGPAGMGAKFSGRQQETLTPDRPAIKTGNVTAEKGNATVRDETERGIETEDVTAGTDVIVEAKARPDTSDPKADPPS